jgi:Cdc6-like AAA superfamily ATPase
LGVGAEVALMETDTDLADLPLPQRVVLLHLAYCARTGEEPVHAGRIIQTCNRNADALGDDTLGRLGEAEISRSLNRLEAAGVVRLEASGTSPAGKGRPVYSLAVDPAAVVETYRPDEQLRTLVEAYGDAWN